MNIQRISVSKISPARYNPRQNLKPGDVEYEQLKKSIQTFGYVVYLVWNRRSGNLVSGHQRLKILIELGFTEVDVVVVDLSPTEEKSLNIALNKIEGRWDEEKLANILAELSEIPDFDVSLTGFETPEVEELLDNYSDVKDDDDFDFDACVESIKEAKTKLGDIVQVGPHIILHGDSSNIDDVKRLMQEKKANLVVSDPPYLASYVPGNRPTKNHTRKKVNKGQMIKNDHMPQEQYEQWLKKIFTNLVQFIDGSASIYIWNGFRQFGPMIQMFIDLGFHISNVITWVKPSLCISFSDYNFQSEFCLYGWFKGGSPHRWFGSTSESNIWEEKRDGLNSRIHQNQKPIALAQRAIRNSSKRNDLVLDLFLGSGSTLIAAESLGRVCYGIELEGRYIDAIVYRYINFVGKDKVSEEIRSKYLEGVSQ